MPTLFTLTENPILVIKKLISSSSPQLFLLTGPFDWNPTTAATNLETSYKVLDDLNVLATKNTHFGIVPHESDLFHGGFGIPSNNALTIVPSSYIPSSVVIDLHQAPFVGFVSNPCKILLSPTMFFAISLFAIASDRIPSTLQHLQQHHLLSPTFHFVTHPQQQRTRNMPCEFEKVKSPTQFVLLSRVAEAAVVSKKSTKYQFQPGPDKYVLLQVNEQGQYKCKMASLLL
jgi:hypothetical protein